MLRQLTGGLVGAALAVSGTTTATMVLSSTLQEQKHNAKVALAGRAWLHRLEAGQIGSQRLRPNSVVELHEQRPRLQLPSFCGHETMLCSGTGAGHAPADTSLHVILAASTAVATSRPSCQLLAYSCNPALLLLIPAMPQINVALYSWAVLPCGVMPCDVMWCAVPHQV